MLAPEDLPRLGAWVDGDAVCFRVWAPGKRSVDVVLDNQRLPLSPSGDFFEGRLAPRSVGLRYRLSVDDGPPVPDPWSQSQPEGVHGPSEVISHAFDWSDSAWRGLGQEQQVFYELHVGTATGAGTFEALIPLLAGLQELGVTAIELMPVASFPGTRNWGYDGVFPLAPQASYGGSLGLKRLVDAAHGVGLGVVLDVVFNHLGPEGNYLGAFGPFESRRHRTPWGAALDYDGPSGPVLRALALRCVELWIRDHHLDGLRLDATHAIHDESTTHLLEELRACADRAASGRAVLLIAEDGLNREHLTRPVAEGGTGLDMQWSDDFHHVVRRLTAGDDRGYFRDYAGTIDELVQILRRGWLFEGEYSTHHAMKRGSDASMQPPSRFVFFLQNHDQIGNRPRGDRLSEAVSGATYRALTALLLLAPQTPLLFMGQEWGTTQPFCFFTDHSGDLGRAVTEGRRREAEHFEGGPVPSLPDPQAHATFEDSRPDWDAADRPGPRALRTLHRTLLTLRRAHPSLVDATGGTYAVRTLTSGALELVREAPGAKRLTLVMNLSGRLEGQVHAGATALLDTEEERFGGSGSRPVLEGGRLILEGPCAVLLESDGGRDALVPTPSR